MSKIRTKTATKRIKRIVKQVPVADLKEIIEDITPEIEKREATELGERIPGMVIDGEKVPYDYKYLVNHPEKFGPVIAFIPEVTVPLSFNGVRVQAISGVEMHVPKVFRDIYDNSRRELRNSGNMGNTGYINQINLGAGALEPER